MIKIQVKIDQASLDQAKEKALQIAAQRVVKGFDTIVGPHLLKVSQAKAPVGKRETRNPQRSSFRAVDLAPVGSLSTRKSNVALSELHGLSAAERATFFKKAFGSSTRDPGATQFFRVRAGKNKGKEPTELRAGRGTITGAFIHKPGTLRDSHIYVPARRVGATKVIAEVRATAEYAAAQHEGFNHHAHGQPTGKKVAGRKWMVESLGNVKGDLTSSRTYEG